MAGGGVSGGATSASLAFWSPQVRLLLVVVFCSDDGLVGVPWRGRWSDGAIHAPWGFRPWALCRRAIVSSIDGVGLLRYVCRRTSCFSPRCTGWPSSGCWIVGGGSRLRDSGCGEYWDVSRLMFYTRPIGSVSGGPLMQLLKPCWAMVLRRVRCRRSSAVRGEDGVCSLARDLFVFFVLSRAFLLCVWLRVPPGRSSEFGRVCVVLLSSTV